ncbi:MAG: penicillin-binding protein activator [Pseudomonadota bacterium]
MLSVLTRARKSLGHIVFAAAALVLAACVPSSGPAPSGGNASGKIQVALLVPGGSGQASDEFLARQLQNAARMAASDLGGAAHVDLRVYNTAGNPAQAAAMATQAVAEGAQIILGPLTAQEANAAGVAVAASGVNVLAFSNNPDIAGNNVFILGSTFDNTANRLASYAVRSGKSKIMVVHGTDIAGQLGKSAIERGTRAAGGSIVAEGQYGLGRTEIMAAAPGIAASAKATGANALFLTASANVDLALISQLLLDNGLTPSTIQYLGLTRWDSLVEVMQLPGTQGALIAMPDPALSAQYQARYQATYAEPPHILSGLAYDGIAAIGALMKTAKGGPISKAALTQGAGFVGVNGIFRLRSDGTNERGLAIARIQGGRAVVVDPAPRSFGGFGS